MIRKASLYACFAGVGLALFTHSPSARADEVPATGKGIAGGALLGAEVVLVGEAIAGVKPAWAYVVGGVVGAGGGAVGGYFIEKNANSKVSVYLLAGGMALMIPTIVAVLQATSYTPPDEYTEDRPAGGAPVPEPPRAQPPSTVPQTHYHWQPAKQKLPGGLLDLDEGAVAVAVPEIELRPLYKQDELLKFGLEQQHELRVSVFSATF